MSSFDYFDLNEHYQQVLAEILDLAGETGDPGVAGMSEFLKQAETNEEIGVVNPKLFEQMGGNAVGNQFNSFVGLSEQNRKNKYYVGGIDFIEQPAFLIIQKIADGQIVAATNKFLLQAMQENRTERVQILETFGAPSILWFDEKTKVYNFAGVLLEAQRQEPIVKLTSSREDIIYPWDEPYSYLWGQSFRQLWDQELRGTKLTENKNQCLLTLMNSILIGYPVTLSLQSNAASPATVNFQFSYICTRHISLDEKAVRLFDPNTYAAIGFPENQNKILSDYAAGFSTQQTALIELLDSYFNIKMYGGLNEIQLQELASKYYEDLWPYLNGNVPSVIPASFSRR